MNEYERSRADRLPSRYRPIGAWGYFGYQLLFMIPLIGFICLVIFSLSDVNINRRNFARSYFCIYVILIIIVLIVVAVVVAGGGCSSLT